MNNSPIIDPQLQAEVTTLLARYATCIDNDELEEWPDFFTEDCVYIVQSRENFDRNLPISAINCDSRAMLVDRIVSLREANIYAEHCYRHVISAPLILSTDGEQVSVETSYVVFSTPLDGTSRVFSVGRYMDKLARVDGILKFKEKIAIFDTNSIRTQIVTPI